ncbi:MAG: alanine racemase [Beijerinckiaceae bacterium]|nr:alanine racemase [Beijerinckiaceae bacterium]
MAGADVSASGGQSPPRAESQAVLTIDLAALVANWRKLAAIAAPAECAAVVKADAYGTGLEEAVRALAKAGCRTFFIAHASEARRARIALGDAQARIYALNGLLQDETVAQALLACDARPVIGSPEEWRAWSAHAPGRPCALHIDTGMNRLGASPDEARAIAADAGAGAIDLVMSHFVSSEELTNPLNARQIAAFDAVRPLFANARASLANSSGIFLPARPHCDLVRPGFALYGGNPTPGSPNPMLPVVTLDAQILRVRPVPAGATAGYNATWTAQRDSVLAVIGVGYADGILRSASGANGQVGGEAIIGGVRCPFVGRVSMDLIVIDATNAPRDAVKPGAIARLLGPEITVDDLAARAGTIGYEVLTSLGRRYHRVYAGG